MKTRLIIFLGLFLLLASGIGGYRYYLHKQMPVEDPKHIKELAPTHDPETGRVLGTPPA